MIIGRDAVCDIVLSSPQVSARHAEIRAIGDGTYILEDLDSVMGTFVNGVQIGSARIRLADRISFGGLEVSMADYAGLLSARGGDAPPRPMPPRQQPAPGAGLVSPSPASAYGGAAAVPAASGQTPLLDPAEPALLLRFWNRDLLAPAIGLVRVLIAVTIAIGALVLVITAAKLADSNGSLALALLIGGALVLGLLYAIWSFFPDLAALVASIERHTRRGATSGYRNTGLEALGLLWRYFGVGLLFAAALVPADLLLSKLYQGPLYSAVARALETRIGGLWPLVVNGTLLFAIVVFGYCALQDFHNKRAPRLLTISAALVAFPILALFLSRNGESFGLSFGGQGIILIAWVTAGALAARRLAAPSTLDPVRKGVLTGIAVLAALLLLTKGLMLFAIAGAVRRTILAMTRQQSALDALFQLAQSVPSVGEGGGFRVIVALVSAVVTGMIGILTWIKSDIARTVLDIERNLRPPTVPPQHSVYVQYARIVTLSIAAVLTLVLAVSLGKSALIAAALGSALGPASKFLVSGFGAFELLWTGIAMIIGLVAAYDLVKISFDLVTYTSSGSAPAVARFWALRIIIAIQYVASAVLALFVLVTAWKATDDGLVRLLGVVGASIAYLTFSFAAALVNNLLKLEANVRVDGGTTFTNRNYPGMSFISTAGKVFAWLATIAAALAVLFLVQHAGNDGAVVLLVGTALVALVFILLSSFPDLVRLLMTIESHFVRRARSNAL